MAFDHIFLIAIQSSLLIGLIHGINPCGHSWLVLAPFVLGEQNGKKVFSLTAAFILGTSLACLAIGLSLGALSISLPESIRSITDIITSGVLVLLGGVLIIKPELLHSHSHDHGHDHTHTCDHPHDHSHTHTDSAASHHVDHADHACGCSTHDHSHHDHADHHTHGSKHNHDHGHDNVHNACSCAHHTRDAQGHDEHGCGCSHGPKLKTVTFWGLFVFGFMNMIVPCPTVAIMYSYALDSGSIFKSAAVFTSYALGTAIALAGVIYAIYKVSNAMRTLNRPWLEPLIMRIAGVMTITFGIYSYMADAGLL